jgi:hypothetical protein
MLVCVSERETVRDGCSLSKGVVVVHKKSNAE